MTTTNDSTRLSPAKRSGGNEGGPTSSPESYLDNQNTTGASLAGAFPASTGRLADRGGSSTLRSARRRGKITGSSGPANGAPPPPGSPPPRLARRASQREMDPIDSGKAASMQNEDARTPGAEKQTSERGYRSKRGAHLVPPPVCPPPFVGPTGEGIIRRGHNGRAADHRSHKGHSDGPKNTRHGQQPGYRRNSSRSTNSSSSSSSSRSTSTSSTSTTSDPRDSHFLSDSSNGSCCEDGKTYLVVDDSSSPEKSAEIRKSRRGSGRSTSRKRQSPSSQDSEFAFLRRDNRGRQRKAAKDTAEAFSMEKEQRHRRSCSGSPSRVRDNRNDAPTEGRAGGRTSRRAVDTHDEFDDGDDEESRGSYVHNRNSARHSINNDEKARGSETTATPSPRDHPLGDGGSAAGEPLVDSADEDIMGWLAEPAASGSRPQDSMASSSAGNASPRREHSSDGRNGRNGWGSSHRSMRKSRRTSQGAHRKSSRRANKASHRLYSSSACEREPVDADIGDHDKSSSIAGSGDDPIHDDVPSIRRNELSAATISCAKSGQQKSGTKPKAVAGGWLAAQEDREGEGENKHQDDFEDNDGAASNDSLSDKIVSSQRRYGGEDGDTVEGIRPDNGRIESGSSGDGNTGHCLGHLSKIGEAVVRCNSLMISYERGNTTDMVQCVIVRDRSGMNRLYPQYQFYFEGRGEQLMMVAQKRSKNRTSNYHVFDMKRRGFRTRLSKKNGNYMGKVRTNLKRTEATIFTNDKEVAELGAVSFEKPGLVDHLRDGSQPRKFRVLLPALDYDGAPVVHKVDPYDPDSDMLSNIKQGRHGNMFLLQSKEPTFTKGNYRLNFHGRVTVPSVKNFQLVSPDDKLHIMCQFGKVGEDRFHLDYRAPLNAFQAFCISLAQFNF